MAVGFVLLVLLHGMHIYRTHSVLQGSAWLGLELALPLRLPSMLRYCPGARGLDLAVVVATADFEPAQLTPVRAPGVATDPVGLQRSCVDATCNGTTCHDFGCHVRCGGDLAILRDVVPRVFRHGEAVGRAPWVAVTADVLGCALLIDCLVLLARGIRDSVLLDKLESTGRGAAMACASDLLAAVQDSLDGQRRVGESALARDLDAVSEAGHSAVSPAGTTVSGNVLVLVASAIVRAAHVAPVNGSGKRVKIHVLKRLRRNHSCLSGVPRHFLHMVWACRYHSH